MTKYVLSMMHLAPSLGADLERVARIMTAMSTPNAGDPLRKVTVPAAARHLLTIGVEAFLASPKVAAFLAEHAT